LQRGEPGQSFLDIALNDRQTVETYLVAEALEPLLQEVHLGVLSLIPDEIISLNEIRRISVPIYGMMRWGDLFSPRQKLALSTLTKLISQINEKVLSNQNDSEIGCPA